MTLLQMARDQMAIRLTNDIAVGIAQLEKDPCN